MSGIKKKKKKSGTPQEDKYSEHRTPQTILQE